MRERTEKDSPSLSFIAMKTGITVENLKDHTKNPELLKAGNRLLREAKDSQAKRKQASDEVSQDIAKDVGKYFLHKAVGVGRFSGLGPGRNLGPGKHRYVPGKGWVN